MALPQYDSKISLEEALAQSDAASSMLVLHPHFNSIDERRDYTVEAARDAEIASLRFAGVIEREFGENRNAPPKLVKRYLVDLSSCRRVLRDVVDWYSRLESGQTDAQTKKAINREKNVIRHYIDKMVVRGNLAVKMMKNGWAE